MFARFEGASTIREGDVVARTSRPWAGARGTGVFPQRSFERRRVVRRARDAGWIVDDSRRARGVEVDLNAIEDLAELPVQRRVVHVPAPAANLVADDALVWRELGV